MVNWDDVRPEWPGVENLAPRALAVHAAWANLSSGTRMWHLAKCEGWSRPPPPYTQVEQCRDLVLSGRALPPQGDRRMPLPLSELELLELPNSAPREESSSIQQNVSNDDFQFLRQQLLDQQAELNALKENLGAQPDEVRSSYEAGETTLALLPGDGTGSWNDVDIMKKTERQKCLREHTGYFPAFPKDLELKDIFGDYPAVKALKLTFTQFVKEDVHRALALNKGTIKSLLTVHSKLEDLNGELLGLLIDDDNRVDEAALVSAADVRNKVELLRENVVGATILALDAHAGLRISVANKVMQSIGATHLQKKQTDKETDDFISKDAAEKILERAELKDAVRVATNATKGVFGKPTQKAWGNGGKQGKKVSGKTLSKGFTPNAKRGGKQQTPKTPAAGGRGGKGGKGKSPKDGKGRGGGTTP